MPMEQVEYKFPDPDKVEEGGTEIEVEGNETEFVLEVEGAVGREQVGEKAPKGEVEIEVVDDIGDQRSGEVTVHIVLHETHNFILDVVFDLALTPHHCVEVVDLR